MELQSQLSMKATLEGMRKETDTHFGARLAQTQELISSTEAQLSDVHADTERQHVECQQLRDCKTRLEQITTYRSLLEGRGAYDNLPATKAAGPPASGTGMGVPA